MNFSSLNTSIFIAIKLLICTHSIWAQDAEQHYKSSLIYSDKGAYQQALHTINKALALDTTKADYFLQRAEVYYHLGIYDHTIKDCYTTLNLRSDVPEVYLLRGKVCIITESYGPAILFFGKTLKYTKNNILRFEAYVNRGKAYQALSRYENAMNDFNEAIAIDDTSLDALFPLSEIYLQVKEYDQALQILDKIIIQNTEYAPAYELLGRIARENNDFPKAINAFEKCAMLNPNDVNAHNTLAELFLQINDLDKAMSTLNNSLAIDPLDPNAYKIKGLIHVAQGNTEKGCNTLFRAMQLGYFEKYGYDLLDIYLEKCEE